jgi:uncharacterized OsmC-like protein
MDTKGQGANPVDTFLASLCGCLGHYVRDFMDNEHISSDGFSIDAQADTTADKKHLAEIHVRIDLRGAKLDPGQKAGLLSFVEQCKIHHILAENPGVKMALVDQD